MLLLGCAALVKSDQIYITRCPDLVQYDIAFREKAANELSALPVDSAAKKMIADYITLRDKCRASE